MTTPADDLDALAEDIMARFEQNVKGFRVYDAYDGNGFVLRNPAGFALSNEQKDAWILGAIECLNDLPKVFKSERARHPKEKHPCKNSTTHYEGCECHEAGWKKRVQELEREPVGTE